MDSLLDKKTRLLSILTEMRSVAVAFSGGVDSSVVAKAAQLALGDRATAVTSHSHSVSERDRQDAEDVARLIGIRHIIIQTNEFENPAYLQNDGQRCYHCKTELYGQLTSMKSKLQVDWIVSGANQDDLGDYRPGLKAASEQGIRHPLQEAGLKKEEIRLLAEEWGLQVWDKPASPCLSSRVAPGVAVTPDRLRKIEMAERFLRENLGTPDCRVRLHENDLVRIEVPCESFTAISQGFSLISSELKRIGFRYITLDLEGLRSGNLNQLLQLGVGKPLPSAKL